MKILPLGLCLVAGAAALPVAAQQPLDAHCSSAATQATGYVPGTANTGPTGNRVRGAARGATAGATVGAIQNSQHDNAPDALKDANRNDKAKTGAAAGVVAGGARNRQQRRQGRQAEDAWKKSYDACMASKSK